MRYNTLMHDKLLAALSTVNDPELHRDLVSLGMIVRAEVVGGVADIKVNLTTPACPLKATIQADVTRAALTVSGVESVQVEFGAQVRAQASIGAVCQCEFATIALDNCVHNRQAQAATVAAPLAPEALDRAGDVVVAHARTAVFYAK